MLLHLSTTTAAPLQNIARHATHRMLDVLLLEHLLAQVTSNMEGLVFDSYAQAVIDDITAAQLIHHCMEVRTAACCKVFLAAVVKHVECRLRVPEGEPQTIWH